MKLNLREIINVPGGRVPFEYKMGLSGFNFDGIRDFTRPLEVSGAVKNIAGVLNVTGAARAHMLCVCARCVSEFEKTADIPIEATIVEGSYEGDDPNVFFLDGDYIDLDEIVTTAFVLDADSVILCREDCRGLCPGCGVNLNEISCECKPETDPRLAALGQLLDTELE